jgi:hypothetical protein
MSDLILSYLEPNITLQDAPCCSRRTCSRIEPDQIELHSEKRRRVAAFVIHL